MNADSHEPSLSQSTPSTEGRDAQPKVWVRILSDEEVEQLMDEYEYSEVEKEFHRKMRIHIQSTHYSDPVPVPPEGDFYCPEKPGQMSPLEAAIKEREEAAKRPPELIEDRIVLGLGDTKITRTHRRSLPAQPRRVATPTAVNRSLTRTMRKLPASLAPSRCWMARCRSRSACTCRSGCRAR